MVSVFWLKYGTQADIRFPVTKRAVLDLAATGDWTPATGDTKISKNGGNFANAVNNPAAVGGTGSVGWKLTLTATELSCAELNIQIVDAATKAVEDCFLTVYTFGNASAKTKNDWSADVAQTADIGLMTQVINSVLMFTSGAFTVMGLDQISSDISTLAQYLASVDAVVADIHCLDLPAVKADTAAIKAKTDALPAIWCSP